MLLTEERSPLKSPDVLTERDHHKIENLPLTSENNGSDKNEPKRNIILVQADPELSKLEIRNDDKELTSHLENHKIEETKKEEKKIEEKKEEVKKEVEKPQPKKEQETTVNPIIVLKPDESIQKKKSSLRDSSSSILRRGKTKKDGDLPEWKVSKRFFILLA